MTGSLGGGPRAYRLLIGVTVVVLAILSLSCLAWMVGRGEAAGTTMTAGNGPFYLRCAPAR